MPLHEETRQGIGVAINESRWLDVQVDERRAEVRFLLHVLTLPESGPEPKDPRRVVRCWGVSRLMVSLRNAPLSDASAPGEPLGLDDLSDVVRSFGALPIYGWHFVDPPAAWLERWLSRLSLDAQFLEPAPGQHRLYLFQAEEDRCVELCVQFEDMTVTDHKGRSVSLESFVEGGRRWWEALRAGDSRVQGHGIVPVPSDP